MRLQINTDGGGQPGNDVGGPAAAAYVVSSEGKYIGSRSCRIIGTNNEAEYAGVITALKALQSEIPEALEEKIEHVTFVADSQLIVYQILGVWKAKEPRLRQLRDEARKIMNELPFPTVFVWKRREFNKEPDTLCAYTMVHGVKEEFATDIPPRPSDQEIRKARDGREREGFATYLLA